MRSVLSGIAVAAIAVIGLAQAANADALDDIKKSGKIRIAVDLGVPPYGMTDDKMQPTGSDIETAKLLATDWGLQFEHVPTTGAARIPVAADRQGRSRDLDALDHARARQGHRLLQGLCRAAHRDRRAQERSTLKSMADLDGKTVGTVRGTTHDTQLTKEGPKGMKLVRYEDDATEAQAFLSAARSTSSRPPSSWSRRSTRRTRPARSRSSSCSTPSSSPSASRRTRSGSSRKSTSGSPPTSRTASSNAIYKKYHGNDLPDVILNQ